MVLKAFGGPSSESFCLFTDTRFSTVLVVADELRKAGISIGIAALTCKSNGTITPFSMKAIDAIYAAKPDAIVAIIDEAHTSHFFTFVSTPTTAFALLIRSGKHDGKCELSEGLHIFLTPNCCFDII